MQIHYLKHVSFEGLGAMESMFVERGCTLSRTCMYEDQSLPSIHEIDALIVMGGPMGVNDDNEYPWLTLEKEFIASVIKRNIPVMGICLGAQLIANVLGAQVNKNPYEEIGWFPVTHTKSVVGGLTDSVPNHFDVLHWHADTFDTPAGASNLFSSKGCKNQGFIYDDNTLALQFHLEMLPSHVQAIYQECGSSSKQGPYISSLTEMLAPTEKFQQANSILRKILEVFIFQKLPQ